MKNKTQQLKIAYFNQLGRKELDQTAQQFSQKYPEVEVKLIAASHDDAFSMLNKDQADLAINDLRDDNNAFKQVEITQAGVMAILPKGAYPNGLQMIEKDKLADLTCFIVAKPEEEVAELHLFKDLYQINSPFIAANSVEEAALLVAAGSGYFIMNENTANLISNDSLQRFFLLNHCQLLRQKIIAFSKSAKSLSSYFIKFFQEEY